MAGDKKRKEDIYCAVCNGAAEFRCSGCKEVSYCSKEHQKLDWKNHKNSCKPYEIRNDDVLGRYLVATRDLSPGELVLTESPLVWGPKSMADPEHFAPCVGCYRPVSLDVGERCASCGWPICSGHCPGLKDLRHHGLECVVLTLRPGCAVSYLGDYYRHDALLTLRCLLAQTKFAKKFKKIMELQSHIEDRGPETEAYKYSKENVIQYLQDNFLHALRSVETDLNTHLAPDISDNLLHTICGIIDVNALDMRLNEGTEIIGLFSQACLMEHSCIPNTKHSFDIKSTDESSQFKITVKAIHPIKKGEHITTMYSHSLWGTQARREHLKETKYFQCFCERCKDPTELGTYLSALRCLGTEKEQCGGVQLPKDPCNDSTEWCCDKCDVKIKNDKISFLVSKMGEEVENIQANGPTVKQLEDLISKLSTLLHPHHYHMFSAKHSLIQLYGHQQGYLIHQLTDEILTKKAEMCKDLIDITTKIDPANSRLNLYTSVLYHELFLAEFQMIKKKEEKKENWKNDRNNITTKLNSYLQIAQNVLQDECEGSAGRKLIDVFKDSERMFIRWFREH